jgi:hypothetical protein
VEEDLRERGERLDHVLHDLQWQPGPDRNGGLLKPLAGVGTDAIGTGEPSPSDTNVMKPGLSAYPRVYVAGHADHPLASLSLSREAEAPTFDRWSAGASDAAFVPTGQNR